MNQLPNDRNLDIILPIILTIKIFWVFFTVTHFIVKLNNSEYEPIIKNIEDINHIIYNILMGLLLIYLYNIFTTKKIVCVSDKTKDYLFMYGILMLIGNLQKYIHVHMFTF